ncbi:hypothetical protein SeMB42_g07599 [Synchytrium endobioticum]|uniref:Uncharacterized protein n=1 Tax=Synchytrium endobioticum TaxID=286115 RepID=A0A507C565_9FUNG|nr:hypothetical protein SeMB42_g07599 [Synchytrium endobioticum]
MAAPTVKALLTKIRKNRFTGIGMKFPKFADQLAVSTHPVHFVFETIATIAATVVPTELQDTFDQLFWPPSALNKVYISITRAYHSCVFERLKSLFNSIPSGVEDDQTNELYQAARKVVWDFLVLFHTRDGEYFTASTRCSTPTRLPIDFGLSYNPLEATYSGDLMKELRTQMKVGVDVTGIRVILQSLLLL